MALVMETNLPLPVKRGKVRDIYDLGDKLLIVTTDRISAFDVVLPNGIPHKGATLNGLSVYWFNETKNIIRNHILISDFSKFPDSVRTHPELRARSVIVKKARALPVECVVRGYIAGSLWSAYKRGEKACGIELPAGLQESEKLPEPIFTPATKATSGHDENITFEQVCGLVGKDVADLLKETSIRIYEDACAKAEKNGIILADTKFEFGLLGDEVIIIDEMLTPDSSRFWPASEYAVGRSQPPFDKQYVRDYLESIKWDKKPPAPQLPASVVEETSKKYLEAYRRLTGKELED